MNLSYDEFKCMYMDIESGKSKKFPSGIWNHTGNIVHSIKYLLEEKLCWSDAEIMEKLSVQTFRENLLGGMLKIFNYSPYKALDAAYPGKFKPWELQSTTLNTWNEENGIDATRWMIEKKLNWSVDEVKQNINLIVFQKMGLGRMLLIVYGSDVYAALNAAYPDVYVKTELEYYKDFWDLEKGIAATRNLFENILKWTDEEITTEPLFIEFEKHGLTYMLGFLFDKSPYKALEATYPGRFRPWELSRVGKGFWTKETGIAATKWLVEAHFGNDPKKVNVQSFKNFKLYSMLSVCFEGSYKNAIRESFPSAK